LPLGDPSAPAFGGAIHLEFGADAPSPLAAYVRAVLAARKPIRAPATPPITATLRGVRIDERHLARYRAVCGLLPDLRAPPAYLQALALPLHLAIYTHSAFPLRLLGAVHLRNAFAQTRAVAAGETIALKVALTGFRDTPRGVEHDLTTEVADAQGARVWSGVSTVLSPDRTATRPPSAPREPPPPFARTERFAVPAGTGRRYARASGDFNAIHLYPLTAKLFGFRRPIAHGMWTLARALAALEGSRPDAPLRVNAVFRRPLFLPAEVVLHWTPAPRETLFQVRSAAGDVTHLQGTLGSS
jgi:acyl dehydratase